jgi:hypothetical protein
VDKEKFKAAPEFDISKWETGASNQLAEVYRYYGHEPYGTTGTRIDIRTDTRTDIRTDTRPDTTRLSPSLDMLKKPARSLG